MDLEKNKNTAVVGIFIFLGVVIFLATVLLVGGKASMFSKTIVVTADFQNVNGLLKGNNVWFSGVKVGTVKSVTFNPKGTVTVEMVIEEKSVPYIHSDAKAKMSTDGLVGNKIVVLEGGSPEKPIIKSGDVLGVKTPLDTDEMMATLQENNKNLVDVTRNFRTITRRMVDGQGTLGKLLSDESLLNDLQATEGVLRQASQNTDALTENLAAYSARFNRKGSLANDLVTDTTVFSTLRSTMRQMQKASENANLVVENLRATSNNINSSNSAAGVLLNDADAAQDIKDVIKNLESSSKKLDENMEALQHNFLFRGYFKKKNKE